MYQLLASFSGSQKLAIGAKGNQIKGFKEMVLKWYQDYKGMSSEETLPKH